MHFWPFDGWEVPEKKSVVAEVYGTIGLELDGHNPTFQRKLVGFLRSQGMQNFTINLVTDFQPDYPEGKRCVYLEGLDLLSEDKRKQVLETSKRRDRRLRRQLEEMGNEVQD